MDEDFLLERAVDDDGSGTANGGRKKTRFELDLEKYGSIDAVRSAKTDSDNESEGVPMARRQGGRQAVNAALSQNSSNFDGQTDPDEFFDDDFSKYILSAHDPIAPAKNYNVVPEKKEVSDGGGDDDISSFRFDDNEDSEDTAWAGKQKRADFSALAEEVFDEEALIALGKSIKFGKEKNDKEPEPTKKEEATYDSDEEFSPEGIVNTLSDRFAPFEFEPAPKPEVVVYEKNVSKSKSDPESEPEFKYESKPEPEFKFEQKTEPEPEIKSEPKPEPEPEKKPIFTAAAFAGLAEAVAAAEAAEAAAGSEGTPSSDDMDATPTVVVDDDTVFPAEPPIGYKKPAPKTAREIAQERIAAGTARAATADEIKGEAETKQTLLTESKPTISVQSAQSTQAATAAPPIQASKPTTQSKAPPKEIVSLRDLSSGFNDAEYEKQTGTLPVLGELTDEFSGGKRISGKTTRTDDQIQLMRKQEALAMNILSEDSSNAGTVRAERIIYDLHEKNEKKSRLVGLILLIAANALLFAVAIVGMIFYQGDNSGLAFMFRVTIGIGAIGFIPVKFLQKLISPFMILLALLYVLLGLAGQDPIAANIAFYTIGAVAGLFGFTIRFFIPAVKSLFERRKP
jgi:hypothetical protein